MTEKEVEEATQTDDDFEATYQDALVGNPELRSIIIIALENEATYRARLTCAVTGKRMTSSAIEKETSKVEKEFAAMVSGYLNAPRHLSPDDILYHRYVSHLAWAVAGKIRQAKGMV